jgi:hypothetical protein
MTFPQECVLGGILHSQWEVRFIPKLYLTTPMQVVNIRLS